MMGLKTNSALLNASLKMACQNHGFAKRGNTYFRIVGDGVLQVIKFVREPGFSHNSLSFGLFSMYADLPQSWLTSTGCIPRYSICCITGQRNALSIKATNDILSFDVVPPSEQIAILTEKGFSFLNRITTQKELADALCELDKQTFCEIIWNDELKIAPYLASEQYRLADRVVNAILYQHIFAERHAWNAPPWTEVDYMRYAECYPNRDTTLLSIHAWIRDKNDKRIKNYLEKNYIANCQHTKFCLSK